MCLPLTLSCVRSVEERGPLCPPRKAFSRALDSLPNPPAPSRPSIPVEGIVPVFPIALALCHPPLSVPSQTPIPVRQAPNPAPPAFIVAVSSIPGFSLRPHPIWPARGIPRLCAAAFPRDIQVIGELISSQGARHQVPKPTDLFPPDPETWPSASGMTRPRAFLLNMDCR